MTKIYGCLDRNFLSYLLTLALRQIQTSRLCFVIPDYTAEELGFSLKSLGRGIAMLELLELLELLAREESDFVRSIRPLDDEELEVLVAEVELLDFPVFFS